MTATTTIDSYYVGPATQTATFDMPTDVGTLGAARGTAYAVIEAPVSVQTVVGQVEFVVDGPDASLTLASAESQTAWIYDGGTIDIAGAVTGASSIDVSQSTTLALQNPGSLLDGTWSFAGGGVLEVAGTMLISDRFEISPNYGGILTVTTDAGTIVFRGVAFEGGDLAPSLSPNAFTPSIDPATGLLALTFVNDGRSSGPVIDPANQTACYAQGTMIAVADGERDIASLRPGDLVRTASGELRPVRWVGRRFYGATDDAEAGNAAAIRIRAGAIAAGIPRRDLIVSPQHAMLIDGLLVPACALLNGISVVREPHGPILYLHVELDTHDAILADGAPSESFSDCDNLWMFENAADRAPAERPMPWSFCAPRLECGPRTEALRHRLARRAAPAGPMLRADGVLITATETDGYRFRFDLDHAPRTLRLLSPSAVPALLGYGQDERCLGIAVAAIAYARPDARAVVDLAAAALRDGWHRAEATHRWTNGDASLPVPTQNGPVSIDIRLAMTADAFSM